MSGARVLVIDSYDSFVFNLVQYLGELGAEPLVHRNDALGVDEALALAPDAVLLSPGPGRPEDAGIICAAIEAFAAVGTPVLGGVSGIRRSGRCSARPWWSAPTLMHGKTSAVTHDGTGVFAGLSSPFTATRYHSLTLDPPTIPAALEVIATADDGVVMGVRHRELPVHGVQFHPESILTGEGHRLLANFLATIPARVGEGLASAPART